MTATIVYVRFRQDDPMHLMPTAEPLPLATDEYGVVRVGGTWVTLDTVVLAFRDGIKAQ